MYDFKQVLKKLIDFRDARDWQQFHDSKNLSLALSIEASELNELFLWKKDSESENIDIEKLKEELADVLSFAFLLAEKHQLDPFQIVSEKIDRNAEKYPVDKAKGRSDKYDQL